MLFQTNTNSEMSRENIGRAKWNIVMNKLPTLTRSESLSHGDKRQLQMKRAKSCVDSDADQITILFDLDALFENELKFFNEQTDQSLSKSIAEDFYQRRMNTSYSLPMCLAGLFENRSRIPNAKSLITAEYNATKKLARSAEKEFKSIYKDKTQTMFTNIETLLIGPTNINYLHQSLPNQYCYGDYLLVNFVTYRECCIKLIDLNLSSEQLATLMLNFISYGIPVNLDTLQKIETPKKRKFSQLDVDFLNRLIYHFGIKEVAKYMLANELNYKIPLATAHAMSIVMLRHGILDFSEVINSDSRYGVFTGKQILDPGNVEKTTEKVKRIFRKYQKYQAESELLAQQSNDASASNLDPQLKLESEYLVLRQVFGIEENANELQFLLADSTLKKIGLQRV